MKPDFRLKYPPLNLPPAPLRIEEQDGSPRVFDPLRRRVVGLTPEAWVRQHCPACLIRELH